jgi:hypothetical protein
MARVRQFVTRIQWVAVAIWTAMNLAAYALVNWIGDTVIRNSDQLAADADTVVTIFESLSFLQGLGFGLIAASWALGTLFILAVGWLARLIFD